MHKPSTPPGAIRVVQRENILGVQQRTSPVGLTLTLPAMPTGVGMMPWVILLCFCTLRETWEVCTDAFVGDKGCIG